MIKERMILITIIFILIACALYCIHIFDLTENSQKSYNILDITDNGVILWYNQPSSEFFQWKYQRTYFSWLTNDNQIQINYYDHSSGNFSQPVTLFTWKKLDDHSGPTIHIIQNGKNKGRLIAFFSFHNTPLLSTMSDYSENITEWGKIQEIDSGKCSYSSIIEMDDGTLMVFYRKIQMNNSGLLVYRLSSDGGETWSKDTILADFGENTTVYFAPIFNKNTNIYLAYNIYNYTDGTEGDIYFSQSDNGGKTWMNSKGETVNIPLNSTNSDIVYNTQNGRATRVWDIKVSNTSDPIIVFIDYDPSVEYNQERNSTNFSDINPSYTYYSDFQNEGWETSKVSKSGMMNYPTGIVIDEKNPEIVFVSVKSTEGFFEIEEYQRGNQDNQWMNSRHVTTQLDSNQYRPQIIRNYSNDMKLVWISSRDYFSGKNFSTSLKTEIHNNKLKKL